MSNLIKCDKCKKYIIIPERNFPINFDPQRFNFISNGKKESIIESYNAYDLKLDLCEDCKQLFFEFMGIKRM